MNDMTVGMALAACFLEGTVPVSTIYSRVKVRREQGTYDGLRRRRFEEARQELGIIPIIDITATEDEDTNVSPVTTNSNQSGASTISAMSQQQETTAAIMSEQSVASSRRKKYRHSSRQSSISRLDSMVVGKDWFCSFH